MKQYIHIDSTYRNRAQYPHPASFEIILSQNSPKQTALDSYDPLSPAYPLYPSPPMSFTGLVPNLPVVSAYNATTFTVTLTNSAFENLSAFDNDYTDNLLEIVNNVAPYDTVEFGTIVSYDASALTVTLKSALSADPSIPPNYFRIRQASWFEQDVLVGGTSQTVVLPTTSSSVDGYYVNRFVWLKTGISPFPPSQNVPYAEDVRIVRSYDGATRTATLNIPYIASTLVGLPTAGAPYEMLAFSRDNVNNLTYSGSMVQQNTCYCIRLVQLILPLAPVKYGGNILQYSYVILEFINQSNRTNYDVIYSNNPNASSATFIIGILDVQTVNDTNFIVIEVNDMTPSISFRPNDSFVFRLRLPDGNLVEFAKNDTVSPSIPDPTLQISAVFELTK
jgi:hypothetical protein